jgi:hypothetical protein
LKFGFTLLDFLAPQIEMWPLSTLPDTWPMAGSHIQQDII